MIDRGVGLLYNKRAKLLLCDIDTHQKQREFNGIA
jgi:hypothetical protein